MQQKLTKIEVQEIVNDKYANKNFVSRNFGSSTYKEIESVENSTYRKKEQTNNLKIYVSRTPYIILIVITSFFLLTFPYLNKENPTTLFLKILYLISFLLIVYSLYKILSNRKLYIQVLTNSFVFKGREIKWNEIMTTGKLIIHGKPSHEFLVLGLDSGEILKIDIDKSEIYTEDFIKIIHLNKT
jgi:hypothetical protein